MSPVMSITEERIATITLTRSRHQSERSKRRGDVDSITGAEQAARHRHNEKLLRQHQHDDITALHFDFWQLLCMKFLVVNEAHSVTTIGDYDNI